jgi:RHH-type proline utilization regulon transcriptional repressor/proline dehydrogenase/delta 1-pyrroline-5-carboxylate dehydrogenase
VLLLSQADDVTLFAAERVVSIDTTASGGNATLLTLSEG